MELLSPEFLKLCGLEPVNYYPEWIDFRIKDITVCFLKDGTVTISIDDDNKPVGMSVSRGMHAILIDVQNYTIAEFKHLCYGLRIQLHTPPEVGQTPGHYGC